MLRVSHRSSHAVPQPMLPIQNCLSKPDRISVLPIKVLVLGEALSTPPLPTQPDRLSQVPIAVLKYMLRNYCVTRDLAQLAGTSRFWRKLAYQQPCLRHFIAASNHLIIQKELLCNSEPQYQDFKVRGTLGTWWKPAPFLTAVGEKLVFAEVNAGRYLWNIRIVDLRTSSIVAPSITVDLTTQLLFLGQVDETLYFAPLHLRDPLLCVNVLTGQQRVWHIRDTLQHLEEQAERKLNNFENVTAFGKIDVLHEARLNTRTVLQ